MSEHSPLPWTHKKTMGLDYWEFFLQDSSGEHIVNTEDKANAEFVLRACNAHYDLLAACEAARMDLARLDCANWSSTHKELVNQIKAAIAKAKVKNDSKGIS